MLVPIYCGQLFFIIVIFFYLFNSFGVMSLLFFVVVFIVGVSLGGLFVN